MFKVSHSPMNFIAVMLFMGSLFLVLSIMLVPSLSAQATTPQPASCPSCTYIGSIIKCTDRTHCAYPNFDGEYYQYNCCDCNGTCRIEENFSGNCRKVCLRLDNILLFLGGSRDD